MADMLTRVVATLKNFDMVQYDRDEAYERLARAVIAAMREPTQDMLDAACWRPSQPVISLDHRWRTMIDAALLPATTGRQT